MAHFFRRLETYEECTHQDLGYLLGRITHLENGVDWLLAWTIVLDLRTLGLRSDHVGVVDPKVHMA